MVLFPAILPRENDLYRYRCSARGRSLRDVHVGHLLIYNCQAVRDVVASHDMLMHVFERIHFFLQRLKSYVGMPQTDGFIELLGKIMAQLLSILALSTKAMAEGRLSELMVLI